MAKRALHLPVLVAALTLSIAASASAQTIKLEATLTGGEETPAPGLNTGAYGVAEVGVDVANREVVGGNAYINIHTTRYPAGEICGQLIRKNS